MASLLVVGGGLFYCRLQIDDCRLKNAVLNLNY